MKIYLTLIVLLSQITFAQENEALLESAISKLIDENQIMRTQIKENKRVILHLQEEVNSLKLISKPVVSEKLINEVQKEEVQKEEVQKELHATVSANVLNVRNQASLKSNIIFTLAKGEKVVIGEHNDIWAHIYGHDWDGWVGSQWLTIEEKK